MNADLIGQIGFFSIIAITVLTIGGSVLYGMYKEWQAFNATGLGNIQSDPGAFSVTLAHDDWTTRDLTDHVSRVSFVVRPIDPAPTASPAEPEPERTDQPIRAFALDGLESRI